MQTPVGHPYVREPLRVSDNSFSAQSLVHLSSDRGILVRGDQEGSAIASRIENSSQLQAWKCLQSPPNAVLASPHPFDDAWHFLQLYAQHGAAKLVKAIPP